MNKNMFREIKTFSIMFLAIFLLAYAGQAAVPVSPTESRFVWEPGEKLTFTWTHVNFDRFYYDSQNKAGNETLSISLENMKERTIPKDGIEYSTTVAIAAARYRQFGKYAVIGFMGEKCIAGYPVGRSNISNRSEISLKSLHKILKDENTIHTLAIGSSLALDDGYLLTVTDMNIPGNSVMLSLLKNGDWVDTKIISSGENYFYKIKDMPVIAVHVDPFPEKNENNSVTINGIFQVSEYNIPVNEGDIYGIMKITKVSDSGITMRNTAFPVNLIPGDIIEIIDGIKLKVANSTNLRIQLFFDGYHEKSEHRGTTLSNGFYSWDGLNYAGFWYEIDSGNYSESLEITNKTGRMIPPGGITYTSYRVQVPYTVTSVKGKKPPGTDGSYFMYSLGGKKYAVRNNGLARILLEQGDGVYEKKTVSEMETWELGDGYTLISPFINTFSTQWDAQIILKRNGIELQNIRLLPHNMYAYAGGEDPPIFITYLEDVFSGTASFNMIQLKYTWLISSNVTNIKEGDVLGVFKVTKVRPEIFVLENIVPIDLKAGSIINLFGNLSFFVENSDELSFYPTNIAGAQVISDKITECAITDPNAGVQDVTVPSRGRIEKSAGFDLIILLAAFIAVYRVRGKMHG